MEGTRHEKIFIVLLAYTIGFTTAFIGFGLSSMNHKSQQDEFSALESVSTYKQPGHNYKQLHAKIDSIGFDDSGLYASVRGYKRILSAKQSTLVTSVAQSLPTPGFYTEIYNPLLSPDGWFAFFCEQTSVADKTCTPYVYSLYDDTVYGVSINGQTQHIDIQDSNLLWSSENELVINGWYSVDGETPWKFFAELAPDTLETSDEQEPIVPAEVQ